MTTTTLYLIRHGQTANADEKRYQGRLDVPLSRNGERQIRQLAGMLKNRLGAGGAGSPHAPAAQLEAVFCSDLGRAVRSAEILGASFGLTSAVVPAFRERDFGEWEGLTFAEIMQRHPSAFEAWAKDPLAFSPPGGESTLAVRDRVMPVFEDIVSRSKGKKIAIVAHGGVNRIILCEVVGISLQNIFRIEQDFGALNQLLFVDGFPVLKALNCRGKLC